MPNDMLAHQSCCGNGAVGAPSVPAPPGLRPSFADALRSVDAVEPAPRNSRSPHRKKFGSEETNQTGTDERYEKLIQEQRKFMLDMQAANSQAMSSMLSDFTAAMQTLVAGFQHTCAAAARVPDPGATPPGPAQHAETHHHEHLHQLHHRNHLLHTLLLNLCL